MVNQGDIYVLYLRRESAGLFCKRPVLLGAGRLTGAANSLASFCSISGRSIGPCVGAPLIGLSLLSVEITVTGSALCELDPSLLGLEAAVIEIQRFNSPLLSALDSLVLRVDRPCFNQDRFDFGPSAFHCDGERS